MPSFNARQNAMRAALSSEELATFDRLLSKMVSALPDWVDSSPCEMQRGLPDQI